MTRKTNFRGHSCGRSLSIQRSSTSCIASSFSFAALDRTLLVGILMAGALPLEGIGSCGIQEFG